MGRCQSNLLERTDLGTYHAEMTKYFPFRYFKTSPEIIRLAVMRYIRLPTFAPQRGEPSPR